MTQATGAMDWMFPDDPVRDEYHNAHVETARWSRHDAHWQEWDWLRREAIYEKRGLRLIRPSYVQADSITIQPMHPPVANIPILTFTRLPPFEISDQS